jgi:NitT/TauT family transport system substrate-binding protein
MKYILAALVFLSGNVCANEMILRMQLERPFSVDNIGFLVAEANGLYRDQRLKVTLSPGNDKIDTLSLLEQGQSDVVIANLPSALRRLHNGLEIINIAQLQQAVGYKLLCLGLKDKPISAIRGKTVTYGHSSDRIMLDLWMNYLGFSLYKKQPDIKVNYSNHLIDSIKKSDFTCAFMPKQHFPLVRLQNDLDYAEYLPKFTNGGVMGNGIYVLRNLLKDEKQLTAIKAFLAATKEGWKLAFQDKNGALKILTNKDRKYSVPYEQAIRSLNLLENIFQFKESPDGELCEMNPKTYEYSIRTILATPELKIMRDRPKEMFFVNLQE